MMAVQEANAGAAPGDDLRGAPAIEAPLSSTDASSLAVVLTALADPVRLRLLSILAAHSEVCSCNLEAPLGKSQSTISHHTRILSQAGLIEGDRRGKWTWWRIVPGQLEFLRRALDEAGWAR
jgi:ArsR family transcriptional regulator, arsenate/arsenite/antimonite-responsive transcriptional repressor